MLFVTDNIYEQVYIFGKVFTVLKLLLNDWGFQVACVMSPKDED